MRHIAIYAGSFDPLTNGHIDILRRSFHFAEKVIIAIGIHPEKQSLFTFAERKKLIQATIKELPGEQADHIEIIAFDNLLVTKAREIGAFVLIRGLRNGTDLDYEMQLASMNSTMEPDIQTVFLPASASVRAITATLVRQIAAMGGDITHFVPEAVAHALNKKFRH